MIVDIQIKVGCQKATNGWLENPLVDDILMVDKRKEKVPAGKNILLKLKKKKFSIIFTETFHKENYDLRIKDIRYFE